MKRRRGEFVEVITTLGEARAVRAALLGDEPLTPVDRSAVERFLRKTARAESIYRRSRRRS